MLTTLNESGQLKLAIDTQARAVMLPIPCEIINAGGTRIDSGLTVEEKVIFIACAAKRREIIRKICRELIVGFSFLETNIKIQEQTINSLKVKSQEKKSNISKLVESKTL